jgi:tetratricopeptide (TPR) repeat protein
MKRHIWIGLVVAGMAVSATAGAKRRAYNQDYYGQQRPQHKKQSLWQSILKPHADEVADLLFEARQIRDQYAQQYYDPSQLTQRRKVLADAVARFERAHQLDPDDMGVLLELANVQFEAAEYEKAVDSYVKYRENIPDDQAAASYYTYYNLGECYTRLGRFDDAATILERGIADSSSWQPMDRGHTLVLLGYVYMAQNRLDDAIDVDTRAASIQPYAGQTDQLAIMHLAVAYDRDEQLGRAQEMMEQEKQLDPNFTWMMQQYPVQGSATPQSRYYVPYSPPADRHYWLAMVYEAEDKLPEAASEWRAYAESVDPVYKHRAEAHEKDVKARLVARAKAAKADEKGTSTIKVKPIKAVPQRRRNP